MLMLSGVTHVYGDGTRALDGVRLIISTDLFGLLHHLAVLKGFTRAGERREMPGHLLSQTSLWSVRCRPVASFSGRMRQRSGIARALLGLPSLIIVDEPTAGLDPHEAAASTPARSRSATVSWLSPRPTSSMMSAACARGWRSSTRTASPLQGVPQELTGRLQGRGGRSMIRKDALPDPATRLTVIRSQLHAGSTIIHVPAGELPAAGFVPVEPHLDDLHFATFSHACSRQAASGEGSSC